MDRGVFVLLLFVGICQYVQCQPLPICPGKEDVITTCEAFPQECDRDSDCSNGQSCCQYGCGRRICYRPNIVKVDICSLPSETGPCRAAFRRWFYNKKTRQCERFVFGGCKGNRNNFKTEQECEKRCGRRPVIPDLPVDICSLPSETGPCRAAFRRWFYNKKTRQCETFIFGGCQGNGNNFKTERECEKRCDRRPVIPDIPVDTCSLPKVVGPCEAAIRRWYFNKSTGRCQKFSYGGCQGNKNNFSSRRACNRRCRRHRRYRPVIRVP